jgi:hypothetical protein
MSVVRAQLVEITGAPMNEQRRRELRQQIPHEVRRGCWHKARYPSKKNAAAFARTMERLDGEPMNAYRCRECHSWHIGHDSSTRTEPAV